MQTQTKAKSKEPECYYCHLPQSRIEKPHWKGGTLFCDRCWETHQGQQKATEGDGRRKYQTW